MEQILNKLSEIETTAKSILKDADLKKQALSEEMEKQCREFDALLEQETDDRIHAIRSNLEQEKDNRLAALRNDRENAFKRLDVYYEKNHDRLSEELFRKIL